MKAVAAKVQDLQRRLQQFVDTSAATQAEIGKIQDQTAQLLFGALSDENHPLAKMLVELQDFVGRVNKSLRQFGKSKRTDEDEWQLFNPQPGTSHDARRFWPLQFLLLTAACAPNNARPVAELLLMSVTSMRRSAVKAYNHSAGTRYSLTAYAAMLKTAIDYINFPEPPVPVSFDGNVLSDCKGNKVRLRQQQAKLFQLLFKQCGTWVSIRDLRKTIANPKQTKCRLIKKCESAGISIPAESRPGAYRLPEVWR